MRTRRRKHHDCHSNYSAIDLEAEHRALNNNHSLFLMLGPLDEIRAEKINRETALSRAERLNIARKRYIRAELQTLIAA
jgi:hypothetical protein